MDPAGIASAAIAQYDKDGDQILGAGELDGAPSINSTLGRIDTNEDGQVAADEIARYIEEDIMGKKTGMVRIRATVSLDGRRAPDGTQITFEPEDFMGGIVNASYGEVSGGTAFMSVAEQDRPHPNARGCQPGLYLIRVSHIVNGEEQIPARYNSQTELGVEVARWASYLPGPVPIAVKSK